jgi:hypothetical protein
MVKSSRLRGVSLLAGLFFGACPACAVVLDFQDAVDMKKASELEVAQHPTSAYTDAAADAAFDATADATAHPDAASDAPHVGSASCVPAPATDWAGPLAIYEGSGSSSARLPACKGAFATPLYDGFGSPVAAAAACTCKCGAPLDVICSAPTMTFYSDWSCKQVCGVGQSLASSCNALNLPGTNGYNPGCLATSFRLSGSDPSGGSCAPEATVTLSPPTWKDAVRLCAPAVEPAACGAGQVTVPPVGDGFQKGNYCVARSGEWACPSGYPSRRTYHESAADTRSCSACNCGAPTGASCGAPAVHADMTCGGTSRPTRGSKCDVLGNASAASFSDQATGGACAPHGGAPIGTVAPDAPTTICCTM